MNSYKIPKKRLISYIVASIVILVVTAFSSGFFVGNQLGYEKGKSENDVLLSSVVRDFIKNKGEFKKFFTEQDSKYAAFGEVIEMNDNSLTLMNIFGIRKEVLKTEEVNLFADVSKGERIFVVGEPENENILRARFYKKMPIPALTIFGK